MLAASLGYEDRKPKQTHTLSCMHGAERRSAIFIAFSSNDPMHGEIGVHHGNSSSVLE